MPRPRSPSKQLSLELMLKTQLLAGFIKDLPLFGKTPKLSFLPIVLLACMIAPVWVDYMMTDPTERQLRGSDIFYIWQDGKDIASGRNPYASIHGSDMIHNNKYSTYLPGFFLLEVLLIKSGISTFSEFFPIWRFSVTLIFSLTGIVLYEGIRRKNGSISLSLFSAFFWLLGRWSFSSLRIWQIDFLAILLLVFAVLAIEKKSLLSFMLLGVSLSIKQIGIFVVPIFLIKLYLDNGLKFKSAMQHISAMSLMPVLVSLPFILWDAIAYFKSLFFSLTRNSGGLKLETIDQVFDIIGLPAKIPLFAALILVYIMFFRVRISVSQAVLMAFLSFVTFNSLLFKQYLPWACAFVGLALADSVKTKTSESLSGISK